jgi:sulfur carrier protein
MKPAATNPPPPATRTPALVIANGQPIEIQLPCSIEAFLVAQNLQPRSVVVECNGEAMTPSEFPHRRLRAGDRLEIVKIVAGG